MGFFERSMGNQMKRIGGEFLLETIEDYCSHCDQWFARSYDLKQIICCNQEHHGDCEFEGCEDCLEKHNQESQ